MAYNKVIYKGEVLVDLTQDSVTAETLAVGATAHDKSGEVIVGTFEGNNGIDTSDATATSGDILSGKTAYVKGSKITGTIAFQPAQTITPGTTNQTIASGKYLTGTQTIKGDANLVASNIVSGKSIFGVVGTATAGSGGGDTSVEDGFVTRTLTSYTNDRVTYIGERVFYYFSSLTSVSFPVCTTIGSYAFQSCSSLRSVSFPVCTAIESYAFYCCSKLTRASFPACTTIGASAFRSCSSLTSVSFPVCTTIESYAFGGCTSLTSVSFPACTTIGVYAFNGCRSLTSVSFPACTAIGSSAFQACSKLFSIYLGASSLCTLASSNAFSTTSITAGKGSIFVRASLLSSYKTAANWSYFSTIFYSYDFT
jgi:hypothetical protein